MKNSHFLVLHIIHLNLCTKSTSHNKIFMFYRVPYHFIITKILQLLHLFIINFIFNLLFTLSFIRIALLFRHYDAICLEPKQLKHLISSFLESWECDLDFFLISTSSLSLGGSVLLFETLLSYLSLLSPLDLERGLELEECFFVHFLLHHVL